jgi:short-subunit dehydrogenase
MTRELLPDLRKNKGRIVNTGSTMGKIPTGPRLAAYAATKYALDAFTHALRQELQGLGVSVSILEVGVVATPVQGKILDEGEAALKKVEKVNYPHLINEKQDKKMDDFASTAVTPDSTVAAMDHAMFDKYPKTRYITAVMGPMPSWLFLRITWLMPDRAMDILSAL